MKGPVACLLAMAVAGQVSGTESVLFGRSEARACYLAALRGGDEADVAACTLAIEHEALVQRDLASTYSNRGLLLSRLGDSRRALADHDKAIRLEPEMDSLYVNRSNALVRAGRYGEAMEDLERAIAMGGDSLAAAHYNRALMFQRFGDREAARADAERAAALSPDSEMYRHFAEGLASPNEEVLPSSEPD